MRKGLLAVLILASFSANSQILISLLFGDKLNSDKLEFGVDGGVNFATIKNLNEGKPAPYFNLGFYFDITPFDNRKFILNTGLLLKSTQGIKDLSIVPFGNQPLDSLMNGGKAQTFHRFLNVPASLKFMLDDHIYLRGGVQMGYLTKATKEFTNDYLGNPVTYKDVDDSQLNKFDFGAILGFGYKLKGGMGISATYYWGLLDIAKNRDSNLYYRSLYLNVSIPVGAKGKSE